MSHLGILRKAKAEGLEEVLILEDDAKFCEDFDYHFQLALMELPEDWDALWLGGTVMRKEYYSQHLSRLKAGTGGYGVLFRNTVFDAMIEQLERKDHVADVGYMKMQEKFNCFRTNKNLILHPAGWSIIKDEYVSYANLEK